MKIGVIGVGKWGLVHAKKFLQLQKRGLQDVEVAAVFDPRKKRKVESLREIYTPGASFQISVVAFT